MDIYARRDKLLQRLDELERGLVPPDPAFRTLMMFENWCTNSGLAGFAQVADEHDLALIEAFARRHDLEVVVRMVETLRQIGEAANSTADDDDAHDRLSRHDRAFDAVSDDYTAALYDEVRPATRLKERLRAMEASDPLGAGPFLCAAVRGVFEHLVPEHRKPVEAAVGAVEAWLAGTASLEQCHAAGAAVEALLAATPDESTPAARASLSVVNAGEFLASTGGNGFMGEANQTSVLDFVLDATGYALGSDDGTSRNSDDYSEEARDAHAGRLLEWLSETTTGSSN